MTSIIKRTERGWAGHFICAHDCLFRRNTLLENSETGAKIIVSTVGLMRRGESIETIGFNRYYETMAFAAEHNGRYWDARVSREVDFDSPWSIAELDADDKANDMHEAVVQELRNKMILGYEPPAAPVFDED
jgi:hypothetical protein